MDCRGISCWQQTIIQFAYVKWPAKADAERAFASKEVREKIVKNAGEFMDSLQSQEARAFDGTVHDADFINMKF